MVFQLSRTFLSPAGSQSGQPSIGAGAQTSGPAPPYQMATPWDTLRPTQGWRSWLFPSRSADAQRGFPSPENNKQKRPLGSMPNRPPVFGGVHQQYTPYYDRGAAAYVPNFGKVLTNPIGAGVVARYRSQASYGPAAQYANAALWWTSQVVPTTINLQGLTDPEALAEILDSVTVQAVVRTTG